MIGKPIMIGWWAGCAVAAVIVVAATVAVPGPVSSPQWRLFAAAAVVLCGGLGVAAALVRERERSDAHRE